jgi:4-diphosphocytidyl-2-C-methyl-D-erythritol kinase
MEDLSVTEPCFEGRLNPDKKKIFISTPAKINLFLKVSGKRSDGYHDIYSWFQAIDLVDHLEIELVKGADIEILTNVENIPTGTDNLVHKAAMLVRDITGLRSGLRIKLWKNIPVGAGLGGGSSDAAALIKGLNKLHNLSMNCRDMVNVGLKIGSDVPFFFSKGQAEVTGRGENITSIALPINYKIALAIAPFEIRAAEAYKKLRLDLTDSITDVSFRRCHRAGELFEQISLVSNDLEKALIKSYPILDKIRRYFGKTGASIVRLSGSGPTIFALYKSNARRDEQVRKSIEGVGWDLKIVNPLILPA